jgi:hypothetical protein
MSVAWPGRNACPRVPSMPATVRPRGGPRKEAGEIRKIGDALVYPYANGKRDGSKRPAPDSAYVKVRPRLAQLFLAPLSGGWTSDQQVFKALRLSELHERGVLDSKAGDLEPF